MTARFPRFVVAMLATVMAFGAFAAVHAATIPVTGDITTSTLWTNDNEYLLTDVIYVTNGATLTIEAGTTVRGEPESSPGANDPGTLVATRGSKIVAIGDVQAPIVFTDEFDDNLGGSPGTPPYDDRTVATALTGQWGGVILLGTGYVANNTAGGPDPSREVQIEGLTAAGGLGLYGGCSSFLAGPYGRNCDDDDSGTLNYVSIRYGGFNLAPANEINGLTLGGVGRETDLDYIEVFQNKDDGVEFFGGAAYIKHLIVANVGDDGVDYDEGWRGRGQFILVMQGTPGADKGDKGGEHDGGNSPDASQPRAIPTIYNATYIGLGAQKAYTDASRNSVLHMRDNAGGRYYNSFFADFGGAAALIEGGSTTGTDPNTSGQRSETSYVSDGIYYLDPDGASDRELELANNDWYCIGNGSTVPSGDATTWGGDAGKVHHDPGFFTAAGFANTYTACAGPLPIRQLARGFEPDVTRPDPIDTIDPRPLPASSLMTDVRATPVDAFFDNAPYRGAFSPSANWAKGWSTLDRLGYFADVTTVPVTGNITTSQTFASGNEYVLEKVIYVTDGATLSIEPGTVLRGQPESAPGANDPGSLVISRGSKIQAVGTAQAPIVFTDEFDDNIGGNPGTPPYDDKLNALALTGQWGGVIVLGTGYAANNTAGGPDPSREVQIEGLTAAGGLGLYGGCSSFLAGPYGRNCDDDDSGTMHYVSVRYGGFNLAPANEINGLTLGGVGRETDLDYIEVFQNKDDGVEFFGGAAYLKHFVASFGGDDGVDYDEGWRGHGQYLVVLQGTPGADKSDKGGEHDGGNSPDASQPRAIPTIYNATYIGLGAQKAYTDASRNSVLHMRDNAGGRYYNSFFADFGGAAALIEGGSTTGTDPNTSGQRSETSYVSDGVYYLAPDGVSDRELELANNDWYCIGNGSTIPTGDATTWGGDAGKVHHDPGIFTSFANTYTACAGPLPIRSLSRIDLGGPTIPDSIDVIDPTPAPGGSLLSGFRATPVDAFFENAPYQGAFAPGDNWASGWTTLSRLGYFPDKPTVRVDANITVDTNWTADNDYLLGQVIYVTDGATLTIEPCTTVRGEPESGAGTNDPGALVITRGARIDAVGTPDCPITFTDEFDDNIGGNPGTPPYDNKVDAQALTGQWGGVILLGTGYVANNTAAGPDPSREVQIEGLTAAGGLGLYGGCSSVLPGPYGRNCDDDSSGSLAWTSLRYGGFNLAPANEINGLTLGGVGRGTDLHHIEVFQNKDDGVEFFGGAAEISNLIVVAQGDDGVDYDEGWRGKLQFVFEVQGTPGTDKSDKGGEHDGGNSPDASQPRAIPTIYNATYVGLGAGKAYTDASRNSVLHMRDNAGGRYYNSFFADFGGAAVLIEGGSTTGTAPNTSGERSISSYAADGVYYLDPDGATDRELELADNAWYCIGNGSTVPTGDATTWGGDAGKVHHDPGVFTDSSFGNQYIDCLTDAPVPVRTLIRADSGDPTRPDTVSFIDPRPAAGSPLNFTPRGTPTASGFVAAPYKGAFSSADNWAAGWSTLARLGYFPTCNGGANRTATPNEVHDLVFPSKTLVTWSAPFGGDLTGYDVLRSGDPSDFTGAACVASGGGDTSASIAGTPAPGTGDYFLIRAINTCGNGSLGLTSDGLERVGTNVCP